MKLLRHQYRRIRVTWLVCIVLCVSAIVPLVGVIAQNSPSTPSLTDAAVEVNRAGYRLKPTGLATSEWPNVRLDFSIERSDRTNFKNLNLVDVEPKLDGQIVPTKEGDLKLTESQASAVLVLLDASGSMSGFGVDKLRAAKQSLLTLIDNLDKDDQVSVAVFDEEPRTILPLTADKELLKREIANFTLRKEKSRFTRLYDAVDYGLRESQKNKIKNLLLISDGWEDTPETRQMRGAPTQLESYKRSREESITQFSRGNDIRVFTVAIGDEHGKGLSYVDRPALQNISKGANGGIGDYIELTEASGDAAFQQDYLLSRLKQTLDDLRQSFRYSYSLTLDLGQTTPRDAQQHNLWVGFTVGETSRVQLPVEYSWKGVGTPKVIDVSVKPAIFIASAPRNIKWQQLSLIYLALLSALLVLALIPALIRRIVGSGQSLRLNKSIVIVGARSSLIGSACPNEGAASGRTYLIKEGDVVLVCPNPNCRTPHHLSCWRFNENHCMKRTCELEMVVPPNMLEKYGLMERGVS